MGKRRGPAEAGHYVLLCVVIAASSVVITAQQSKTWQVPRTAWGDPDFDGIWNYATMTPLERPQEFAGKAVATPEEAAAYEGNARSVEGMLRGARVQDASPR